MSGLYTILLLIVSNIFMTFAWYGHLKLQETKVIGNWPLLGVILLSWASLYLNIAHKYQPTESGFRGTEDLSVLCS